jgi:hypothetical protein
MGRPGSLAASRAARQSVGTTSKADTGEEGEPGPFRRFDWARTA